MRSVSQKRSPRDSLPFKGQTTVTDNCKMVYFHNVILHAQQQIKGILQLCKKKIQSRTYLEHDISAHCFAVCYNGFIARSVPAIQLNAP